MAKAWSGSDKRRAQGWLDEAFVELDRIVDAGEDRIGGPQPGACVVGAMLLPVAELIDPRDVRKRLWHTLALNRSHSAPHEQDIDHWKSLLAMLVAHCDRGAARRLLQPLVARVRAGGLDSLATADDSTLFDAAIAVDPNWAVELFDELAAGASMWFNHWLPDMPDNEFQGEGF